MSDSLRAAKIVLFMGAGAGLVGIVRSIPPVQLEAFSSIIKISGTLAGFSAPWLLPAFGIFALVSRDRYERRDFRGSGSSGFFSGSVKTGEIIPGNTDLGGWLANYWLMIYPMVMAYYNHARFPFMKALESLLGSGNFAIPVLDRLVEFSPVVIAVLVAGKVWNSGSALCGVILRAWIMLILAAIGNMIAYCVFHLTVYGLS